MIETRTATPSATRVIETRTATPSATRTIEITRTATPSATTQPPTPTRTCVPPPPSMVAWYALDETTGTTAADLTSFHNTGGFAGGIAPLVGQYVNNARHFDGIDDFVRVPGQAQLNFDRGDFSIDAWVRTDGQQTYQIIVDKRSTTPVGYEFLLYNGKLLLQLADGSGYSSYGNTGPNLADGRWHLVAATVSRTSSTGVRLYADGVLVGTGNPLTRAGSLNSNSDLWIGRHHPNAADPNEHWFRGDIDEVELFSRALTPNEIATLFAAGPLGKCKCQPGGAVFTAGVRDEFSGANGVEAPQPSPAYVQYLNSQGIYNLANFDETHVDRYFAHTFSNLLPPGNSRICRAILEIRLRPLPTIAKNDSISLNFAPSTLAPGASWWRYLGAGNAQPGLLGTAWQPPQGPTTITLDLGALPQAAGGPVSLLSYLNQYGFLNLAIQDDTAVDYAKLTVTYCCPEPDLTIRKTHKEPFLLGGHGAYNLAVTNLGSAPISGPIVVTDNLPVGLGYAGYAGAGWSCSAAGQLVTCTHPGPVAAGASLPPLTIYVVRRWPFHFQPFYNCANVQAPGQTEASLNNNVSCDWANPIRPFGTITGEVAVAGGAALGGIQVQAWSLVDGAWRPAGAATTEPNGHYTLSGLDAGTYHLGASDPHGTYGHLWYGGATTVSTTLDLVVAEDATLSGVNFALPATTAVPPVATVVPAETNGGLSTVTVNPQTGLVSVVMSRTTELRSHAAGPLPRQRRAHRRHAHDRRPQLPDG